MTELPKFDVYNAEAMRSETAGFVEAMLQAHPEFKSLVPDAGAKLTPEADAALLPDDLVPDFDPYPILTTAVQIVAHCSKKYGVPRTLIRNGKRRSGAECRARWEAYYLIRRWLGFSYPWIANYFGGRDHSTIICGVKRHCSLNRLPYPHSEFTFPREAA